MIKNLFKGAVAAALLFDTAVAASLCADEIRFRSKKPGGSAAAHDPEGDGLDWLDEYDPYDEDDGVETSEEQDCSYLPPQVDTIRRINAAELHRYVREFVLPAAGNLYEELSGDEKNTAVLLLSAYISLLQQEAPEVEKDFPTVLELLDNTMRPDEDQQDIVGMMIDDYTKEAEIIPYYLHDYRQYRKADVDKERVIHVCLIAVSAIVQKLYGRIRTNPESEDVVYGLT